MNHENSIIEVTDLVKQFGSFTAVDHISFNVKQGEVYGFLGANGAGKTTAIRILSGLSKPTSGIANVAGFDATKSPEQIKKVIGYMSQKFSLYDDLSVYQNIRFFGAIYGLSRKVLQTRADELFDRLDIQHMRNRLIADLPLGWKQKLAFSIAVLHKPRVVFLDEPTGGVDPVTRRQFWELIYDTSREGITVFVTTHYMDEAEYCDRLCILSQGKVRAIGIPSELKKQYKVETIDEVFYQIVKEGAVV